MRKTNGPLLVLFMTFVFCSTCILPGVRGGEAGVGVINVPPKYGYIRVEEQDLFIRVYLNISDYNSWADISNVSVILYNYGAELCRFLFEQYKSSDSYVEFNKFSEIPHNTHLLDEKKCYFEKSSSTETVDDRCDIAIRFVFQKTFFTGLKVVINDRVGSAPAEAYISYSTGESMRSGNTIVIPWIGVRITVTTPPFLLDIIALALASISVMYYLKRIGMFQRRRGSYEKT